MPGQPAGLYAVTLGTPRGWLTGPEKALFLFFNIFIGVQLPYDGVLVSAL